MSELYFIGIDGGATTTTGVLIDSQGKTIGIFKTKGTNLNIYKKIAVKRVIDFIKKIVKNSKISFDDVSGFGIALAGISDLDQRESLLKELDAVNISSKSIVLSDSEAAYKLLCPSGNGVLISVGTGIVGVAKKNDKTFKVAGKGHNNGDLGSGYWIGKQIFKNLLINSNIVSIDNDLSEVFDSVKQKLDISSIESLAQKLEDSNESIAQIASIAESIIAIAKNGNDLALSIIQEATTYVADYINYLFESMEISKNDVVVACNGSIIKNEFYKKLLADALQFDFKKIHWVFSDLSAAYGAALIVVETKGIKMSSSDIVKGMENV